MIDEPPKLQLLRETAWVKQWQTHWGVVTDSKLRWFGTEPDAARFLAEWQQADAAARAELETAFAFFPYELSEGIEQVLSGIARHDAPAAQRMRAALFHADSELSPELQRFQKALHQYLEFTGAPRQLIGENKWFSVFSNDGGFYFETKIESIVLMPEPGDLEGLQAEPGNLAYQRAIQLVKENLWLLEPAPGEALFPGMEDLDL